MEEVFYLKAGGELIVKPIRTDPVYDLTIVEYKGENYNLLWNPQYSYYQGHINGQEGFLI